MKTALIVLAIWCLPSALIVAWLVADEYLAAREDRRRRAEQAREITPEWLAVLAAVEPTPVYDALVCEQIERAEGWAS